MKKNVFFVNTEYHLVITLGIIRQYYSVDYENTIIRISPVEKHRLNNLSFDATSIDYSEIIYDYSHPTKKLKSDLQAIIDLRPHTLFFFLENKFWMNYFLSRLHKSGTRIVLCPDGMKAYNNIHSFSNALYLKALFKGFVNLIQANLFPSFPHIERKYASSWYIDEVWVEYPLSFNNQSLKRVVEFHYTVDDSLVELLNRVFCVEEKDIGIVRKKPSILFIDSAYQSVGYYNRTIELLSAFVARHPEMDILIKYHPLSKEMARKAYSRIQGVYELNPDYPAEIYVAAAKDSIVVSMVSTSELFYNPSCSYYWIYKLYKDMYDYGGLSNPTSYIHVINSIDEIE